MLFIHTSFIHLQHGKHYGSQHRLSHLFWDRVHLPFSNAWWQSQIGSNNSNINGADYVAALVRERISDKEKADVMCKFLKKHGISTHDDLCFYADALCAQDADITELHKKLFPDPSFTFAKARFHAILTNHNMHRDHKSSSSATVVPSTAAPLSLKVSPSSARHPKATNTERQQIADALSNGAKRRRTLPLQQRARTHC